MKAFFNWLFHRKPKSVTCEIPWRMRGIEFLLNEYWEGRNLAGKEAQLTVHEMQLAIMNITAAVEQNKEYLKHARNGKRFTIAQRRWIVERAFDRCDEMIKALRTPIAKDRVLPPGRNYGYSAENPIRLSQYHRRIPAADYYMLSLRDNQGACFDFRRDITISSDRDHSLDKYNLKNASGSKLELFVCVSTFSQDIELDWNNEVHTGLNPDTASAPRGLTKGPPEFYSFELSYDHPRSQPGKRPCRVP
jgi:hypothetical protein